MVKWVYINSHKITRIGYNVDIETMFIDFHGSTLDAPYKGVPEKVFKEFSKAENADGFYETKIKGFYDEVKLQH